MQVPLTQPLLAEHKYRVSFYVNLARTKYAIKEIGAFFSTTEINTGTGDPLLFTPQVEFSDSIITDTIGWTNIKGYFTAQGNERYLIIGNFHNPQSTTIADVNDVNNNVCYYYLDEVSVTEISVPLKMPAAFSPNGDSKNDTYYSVFFDSLLTVREFRIYNRWGQLIYDNPTLGWDGNYKGEPQPSDVYTYYIYADIPLPDNPNEHATLKKQGSFTLLR
ncbi:MAG: gliding motility-associated C-terminal domain-containing protein [Chitinophagales bacterium]